MEVPRVSQADLSTLLAFYRDGLLEDTIPFWLEHGLDAEFGGVQTSLGRDGELLDSDKSTWTQGRFAWMLGTLYNTVEAREEWRDGALSCLGFLERHAFDDDGRMLFLLTREGQPLRKRRYAFTEAFASMAYASCARATGRQDLGERAVELFQRFVEVSIDPGTVQPKIDPGTRPSLGIGPLMIGINVAQTLREDLSHDQSQGWIDRFIASIETYFCKPGLRAVMETVAPDGGLIDHFDGRMLNPGHAIEAAWFILHESRVRGGDSSLTELGVNMLDWMWERGWDEEFGGLFYFRDLHGGPVQEYWHDMKFWWPHNEAIIACLLAYCLTGEGRHLERHSMVNRWAHDHFADPEHGEWFGYLHREGRISVDLKGNHWKGPFHLPRMQWYCWKLLEEYGG
jgi:N-acylglucosamine 2-epimerase